VEGLLVEGFELLQLLFAGILRVFRIDSGNQTDTRCTLDRTFLG